MNSLNNPIKRAMFIVLLLSSIAFFAISILPAPFSINEIGTWEDKPKNYSKDAEAIILDTACASKIVGNRQSFIKDFWALLSIKNKYRRILMLYNYDNNNNSIAPEVTIYPDELKLIRDGYSKDKVVCVDKYCTSIITPEVFESLIAACGKSKKQYYNLSSNFNWLIDNNIKKSLNIWGWSLFIMVISLLSSILYDKTIGRIINWVMHG